MNVTKTLSAPTTVQLEITKKCNHKCVHCYNPWRNDGVITNDTLSYDDIDAILKELKINNVWHLTITGGEPLLELKKIEYIKKECDTLGISLSLNSNLTCMTDKIARKLKNELNWNTLILTSLPGLTAESCDAITQVDGSYQQIIEGIKICKKNDIRVGVNIVLTNNNIKYVLKEIEDFVKSNPIDYLALTRAIQPSYSCEEKYNFSENDIIFLADSLLSIGEKYDIEIDSLIPFPLCVLKDEEKYNALLHTKCCAGVLECTITADGNVKACSHEDKNYGNILRDGLKRCWDKMETWRNGEHLNIKCRNCENLAKCGGECRQSTYTDYLDNVAQINICNNLVCALSDKKIYLSHFTYNTNIKIRNEEFGYCIHIEGNDYLVDTSFGDIHEYFLNQKRFTIQDIIPDFENEDELVYLVKNLIDMRYLLVMD